MVPLYSTFRSQLVYLLEVLSALSVADQESKELDTDCSILGSI